MHSCHTATEPRTLLAVPAGGGEGPGGIGVLLLQGLESLRVGARGFHISLGFRTGTCVCACAYMCSCVGGRIDQAVSSQHG